VKIPEQSGKWVEIEKAPDRDGEIMMHVPNTIWAAWQVPLYFKEEDLASFLRSIGWEVSLPSHSVR